MADLHNFPRSTAQAPLPALIDLEQALLGAILINNAALGYTSGILKPEHFTEPFHAEIYRRCLTEIAEGRVVTPLTLNASFPDMRVGELTGSQYFARLAAEATTVINAHDYAGMIRAISDMREFILIGDDLRNAREFLHSPIEALAAAWAKLDVLRGGGEDSTIESALVSALADHMLDVREGTAIPTGLYDLDSTIGGGYRTKRLIVCGGRPGMAKTAKMCSLARRIAMNNTGVSIFSLETDQHELMARLVADELARTDWNIPYRDIIAGDFKTQGERDRVMTGAARIKELPIRLDWSSGLSMADIEARARLHQQRFARQGVKLGLVCIDHLGLVKVTDRYRGRRVDELGEVTLAAKNIAKRLDVAVLALVQLSRAVENRDDKTPMLSDLRDCLPGNAAVVNADTGMPVPIHDIVAGNLRFNVWALDEQMTLVRAPITAGWRVGERPMLRLTTRLGRVLRCSAGHRLLTGEGWCEAKLLRPRMHVALPRRLGAPTWVTEVNEDRALLLGWLIGDGYFGGSAQLSVATRDEADVAAALAASAFEIKPKVKSDRNAWRVIMTTGRLCGAGKNPLTTWLRSLGIWGATGRNKFVPSVMCGGNDGSVAAFLRGLFHADGSLSRPGSSPMVRLSTISERLAREVQLLLLRFGINARVSSEYRKPNGFTSKAGTTWTVAIIGIEPVQSFMASIGFLGAKHERALERIPRTAKQNEAGHLDRLPPEISRKVTYKRVVAGWSSRDFEWDDEDKLLSRATLAKMARKLGDAELATIAASDVIWDAITSIDVVADEECFDLTIGGLANFVVDGFLTHNSGNIEEHADFVELLYRPAYYLERKVQRSVPDKDEIEQLDRQRYVMKLILGKNRLGPAKTIDLFCNPSLSAIDNAARY